MANTTDACARALKEGGLARTTKQNKKKQHQRGENRGLSPLNLYFTLLETWKGEKPRDPTTTSLPYERKIARRLLAHHLCTATRPGSRERGRGPFSLHSKSPQRSKCSPRNTFPAPFSFPWVALWVSTKKKIQ